MAVWYIVEKVSGKIVAEGNGKTDAMVKLRFYQNRNPSISYVLQKD